MKKGKEDLNISKVQSEAWQEIKEVKENIVHGNHINTKHSHNKIYGNETKLASWKIEIVQK